MMPSPLSKLDYDDQQARIVTDDPIVGERKGREVCSSREAAEAWSERLRRTQEILAKMPPDTTSDYASLTFVLGIITHWKSRRGLKVKEYLRSVLAEVDAERTPVLEELHQYEEECGRGPA